MSKEKVRTKNGQKRTSFCWIKREKQFAGILQQVYKSMTLQSEKRKAKKVKDFLLFCQG